MAVDCTEVGDKYFTLSAVATDEDEMIWDGERVTLGEIGAHGDGEPTQIRFGNAPVGTEPSDARLVSDPLDAWLMRDI